MRTDYPYNQTYNYFSWEPRDTIKTIEWEDGEYTGELDISDKPEGYGKYQYKNAWYEGSW